MKGNSSNKLYIMELVGLSLIFCSGCDKSATSTPKKQVSETPFAFSLSANNLPTAYTGVDVEALTQRLSSENKSEFETSAAFDKRINEERSRPVAPGLVMSDELPFVEDSFPDVYALFHRLDTVLHYNADKQEFTAAFSPIDDHILLTDKAAGIVLPSDTKIEFTFATPLTEAKDVKVCAKTLLLGRNN